MEQNGAKHETKWNIDSMGLRINVIASGLRHKLHSHYPRYGSFASTSSHSLKIVARTTVNFYFVMSK